MASGQGNTSPKGELSEPSIGCPCFCQIHTGLPYGDRVARAATHGMVTHAAHRRTTGHHHHLGEKDPRGPSCLPLGSRAKGTAKPDSDVVLALSIKGVSRNQVLQTRIDQN